MFRLYPQFLFLILFAFLFSSCSDSNANQENKTELNKKTVSIIYGMFESGNTEGIENYVHPYMIDYTLDPAIMQKGIEGLVELISVNKQAFPDLKIKVYNMSAEGDYVYAHFNFNGTYTGSLGNIPSSGRKIDIDGVDVIRLKDGKIVEHWGYWDTQKFLIQMGRTNPDNGLE
ncbi:MAG: hypothetical protein DWQ44_01830 [Bacteroidetes bacterium]|nr:MAG: hypothetical protein DWQ33_05560 [Bacteroidota bacterium]REK04719.1 MAG: hypothetical protein DWQ39_05725 [Bacteroidota bacterium]REK36193.1 MAG: hypothetical protein DWQ44_01830 [Bacteroidota bacterium]REK51436.1 MAG: hypothetical protein DWQ48_01005 [Bacteroidota bacterium]